jgi:hypothetical protein
MLALAALFWFVLVLYGARVKEQARANQTSSTANDIAFLAILLASVLWHGQRDGWRGTSATALCSTTLAWFVRLKDSDRLRRHEARPQTPKDASKSSVVYRYKMVGSLIPFGSAQRADESSIQSPAECDQHGRV